MTQIVIEFDHNGNWAHKYNGCHKKPFKIINVPQKRRGKDWIIGIGRDNSEAWRKRMDEHTKNAEYDIIVKDGK